MERKGKKLKTGAAKQNESFVKQPRVPNPKIISGKGRSVQTINIHPVISKYG
jgi:hypothetical protein